MIKQCGYCFRVLGDDGTYHGIGLTEPIVHLDVAPPKAEQVPVSHGICADCFQVMVTPKSEIPGNGTLHCMSLPAVITCHPRKPHRSADNFRT